MKASCLMVLVLTAVFETVSTSAFATVANVTIRSQVMTPTMRLDPERITIRGGDTVVWLNLTGQGIKLVPDWEEATPLPPHIRPGGQVQLLFTEPGIYRYSVFTATDRFEEDRVPVSVSGIVEVKPLPPASTR